MALHALQNVDDALEATRSFLFPPRLGRWLKLALIAFFVGGGSGLPTAQFNAGSSIPGPSDPPSSAPPGDLPTSIPDDVLPLLVAGAILVVLVWIVLGVIGATMEFVLIESLRQRRVALREYIGDRWRQGLRLFGFRVLIGLPIAALFIGWVGLFIASLAGVIDPVIAFPTFLVGLAALILLGILFAIVDTLTTVFVVPIMIADDGGVLAAWRRLWASIRVAWKQYLAYLLVAGLLGIAAGLLGSIVTGVVAIGLLLPVAVLAAVVYATVTFASTIGTVILALLVVVFLAAVFVVWLLVQAAVVTYLRYYALLVLGDVEPSLDLIPDQRAAIRT
ncbi:DUF7544 domain-containing protein [Halopenitus persicus]|uniref:Membrane domain of glycerophosphoryl diester phosphodiesterase n=1 Tax=Halopenitus persicus TaxID=1048396 RepID=A0A1H3HMH7_9EURY|nr:hypothetical protein [Halopenitus persicus]QHS15916.1 hypothetical protein GWK26_01445 [haloarchaeon 3A1-DGR]SDY16736.1 hypothetical protein SAMN05216564_103346 [Halopenitus persicus]